jgi:hypothetical protein
MEAREDARREGRSGPTPDAACRDRYLPSTTLLEHHTLGFVNKLSS